MAIVTKTLHIGDRDFTHTYSNSGRYVVRDGIAYAEAYDPSQFGRTYTEGDLIPEESEDIESKYAEAYEILMGEKE